MITDYTAIDAMIGTSPDSDGTAFINPILPLNGVLWQSPRVQDQGLEEAIIRQCDNGN